MKRLLLFLSLLACSSSVRAQDGWFKIHEERVYWYQAFSKDSLLVLSAAGLERSIDGGQSYTLVTDWPTSTSSESGNNRIDNGIDFITFGSPTHGMRMWMTVVYDKHWGEWSQATVDEFTTDGGKTWFEGFSRASSDRPDVAMYFPPSTWFILRKQGIYDPIVPAPVPQAVISTDAGHTWLERTLPTFFIQDGFAANPDRIFVDNYITTDTGLTWTPLKRKIQNMITPSLLYSSGSDTNYFSRDMGVTWIPNEDSVVIRLTNNAGVVYGETGYTFNKSQRYWRSLDSGFTFIELPNFLPKNAMTLIDTTVLYALDSGELLKTKTGGRKLDVRLRLGISPTHAFPNPASTVVTTGSKLTWYDLLGRSYSPSVERTSEGFKYDVSNLNAGVYIVRYGERSQIVYVKH